MTLDRYRIIKLPRWWVDTRRTIMIFYLDIMVISCPGPWESSSQTRQPDQESDSRERTKKGSREEAAPIPNVRNLVHCGAVLEKQACW